MAKITDIIKRWNERVVPNGWDKMGAQGAKNYLEKYGKNVGPEKLKLFADYAKSLGLNDFAEGMIQGNNEWKIVSMEYAEKHNFEFDILDAVDNVSDMNPIIVETTIQELANRNIGSSCGSEGNSCFKEIAKEFPNTKIRTCVWQEGDNFLTSSCEMYIDNEKMGERIQELADIGGGSLRFDWSEKAGWNYFETE